MSEEEKKTIEEMKRCIKYGIDLENNKDVYEIEIIEIYEMILNLIEKQNTKIDKVIEIIKNDFQLGGYVPPESKEKVLEILRGEE